MSLWEAVGRHREPRPVPPAEERSGLSPSPSPRPVLLPNHLVPTARWGEWAPGLLGALLEHRGP